MADASNLPLFDYAATVWRRKWMILLIVAALTVPAIVVSLLQNPVYQASAVVAASQPEVTADGGVQAGALDDTSMRTQAAILNGDDVAARAAQLGATSAAASSLTAQSNVITIVGQGGTPDDAAKTVNAYAQAYIDVRNQQQSAVLNVAADQLQRRVDDLQGQVTNAQAAVATALGGQLSSVQSQLARVDLERSIVQNSAQLIRAAVPSPDPVAPQPVRNAALAVVLGLALGIVAAILLEAVARRRGQDAPAAPVIHGASEQPSGANTNGGFLGRPADRTRHPQAPPNPGPSAPSRRPSPVPAQDLGDASTVTMRRGPSTGPSPGQQ